VNGTVDLLNGISPDQLKRMDLRNAAKAASRFLLESVS